MRVRFANIDHDMAGFLRLTRLVKITESLQSEKIEISLDTTTWIEADMCAVLGAVLHRLRERGNSIALVDMRPEVKSALGKNSFLSYYGNYRESDINGTTIAYRRFDIDAERSFSAYIDNEVLNRTELPIMSRQLQKKFSESIFEMFNNAVQHSKSELGVFSCGQFFPHKDRLNFTITDLGIGIRQNVKDELGLDLTAEAAIEWAVSDNNTTKREQSSPGGLGLKLLREFIDLNGGSIQIVSDAGYWQRFNKQTNTGTLRDRFPGTIIALQFNTADNHSYILEGEDDYNDIVF